MSLDLTHSDPNQGCRTALQKGKKTHEHENARPLLRVLLS